MQFHARSLGYGHGYVYVLFDICYQTPAENSSLLYLLCCYMNINMKSLIFSSALVPVLDYFFHAFCTAVHDKTCGFTGIAGFTIMNATPYSTTNRYQLVELFIQPRMTNRKIKPHTEDKTTSGRDSQHLLNLFYFFPISKCNHRNYCDAYKESYTYETLQQHNSFITVYSTNYAKVIVCLHASINISKKRKKCK